MILKYSHSRKMYRITAANVNFHTDVEKNKIRTHDDIQYRYVLYIYFKVSVWWVWSNGCTSGAVGWAAASSCDDTVASLLPVLSHLHHLSLQQGAAPLHRVLGTNRNQAADVGGTPGGQTNLKCLLCGSYAVHELCGQSKSHQPVSSGPHSPRHHLGLVQRQQSGNPVTS